MSDTLRLPKIYLTSDIPGCGGIIKGNPEDFIVEEVPLYQFSGEGEHLILKIKKINITTWDVITQLSQALNIRPSQIGYCGLKDKISVSYQYISIPALFKEKVFRIEFKGFSIVDSCLHKNKLRLGHLLGNNFSIIIRNIKQGSFNYALSSFNFMLENGFPNFFGPQRFSDYTKYNQLVDKIVRKLNSVSKERIKFFISVWQSYIFNYYLVERINKGLFFKALKGDILKKHLTGGIFYCENKEIEQLRIIRNEVSPTGPLPGPKMKETKDEAFQFEKEVLNRLNITDQFINLIKKKSKGSRRILRVFPENGSIEKIDDSTLKLNFFLTSGSYASVMLDELMKPDSK